ncbi:hypothetical protein EDD15DRAFT_2375721 [Pisolithus albus]|nr:hypothetical protein EDD15DRAFT_2375721 [Pisolithus albus]
MVKAPKPYNVKQSLQLASMGEAIAALQEQMDTFVRNQQAKEHRRKKSKKYDMLSQSEDLIPRPKGRPACSDRKGYRIIELMGLSNQKELFNYLKRGIWKLANRKLDTSRTLAKQKNKLLVEKVIFQAQVEYKIFQNYKNGWPVRDLLAQYLRNSSHPNEKGDTSSEERSEAECNSESNEDDVRGRPVKPSGRSRGSRVHGSSGKSKPRPQKRQCKEQSEAEHDDESDEDDDASLVRSRPVKPSGRSEKSRVHGSSGKSKPRPQKRQREEQSDAECDSESDEDDDASPVRGRPVKPSGRSETSRVHASPGQPSTKGTPEDHGKITSARQSRESDEDEDEADYHSDIHDGGDPSPSAIIPKTCPEMDCEDPIPDHPSEQLRTALTTYIYICRLIKREQCRLKAIEFAEEVDWPVTRVDFKDIPRHVLKLEDELHRLIFDAEAHKNVFQWKCFEAALEVEGCTISQFARMRSPPMSSTIWQNSRSGYYGSKGTAIVMHMLLQLFLPTTPTDTFQPLSLMQYLSYFITPHIFCQLIAEDYGGATTINAQKIMYESSDVGELVNPECDDDDELDQIKCKTTLTLRKRTSDGRTTQDAASALVALRYSKPTDAPGPSKAISRANEAPREKPRNQQSENNVPAEAQAWPPTEAVNAHFRY